MRAHLGRIQRAQKRSGSYQIIIHIIHTGQSLCYINLCIIHVYTCLHLFQTAHLGFGRSGDTGDDAPLWARRSERVSAKGVGNWSGTNLLSLSWQSRYSLVMTYNIAIENIPCIVSFPSGNGDVPWLCLFTTEYMRGRYRVHIDYIYDVDLYRS